MAKLADAAPATEVKPTTNTAVKISAFTFFKIFTPFYCILNFMEKYGNVTRACYECSGYVNLVTVCR